MALALRILESRPAVLGFQVLDLGLGLPFLALASDYQSLALASDCQSLALEVVPDISLEH